MLNSVAFVLKLAIAVLPNVKNTIMTTVSDAPKLVVVVLNPVARWLQQWLNQRVRSRLSLQLGDSLFSFYGGILKQPLDSPAY
ncbi:hypothetical protein NIES2135_63370 (plasmid) [Leptolyngbya boryana NIES-2135]|uniref:Uncharacterized protein n=1 Tax=Leptolyngbya boryana NIES-2135 TaxID=1973484 RepID=A0A1Z4JRX5_LEPBY|nr:hypothetical protein NIES2135_63370 [Leptolyngbya boryana NIES-2135]